MRRMYSEEQVKKLVSESSNQILSALANQDLKVKTIEQSEANTQVTIEAPTITGLTKLNEFCILEQVNKTLRFVFVARYKNEGESAVTMRLGSWTISNIPADIGEKIFDMEGKNLTQAATATEFKNIIRPFAIASEVSSVGGQLFPAELQHFSANTLFIYQQNGQSVPAGNVGVLSFEINIAL